MMQYETLNKVGIHQRALWNNGSQFGTALIFSLFWALLSLTLPMFMLLVYDRVLNAQSSETLVVLVVLSVFLILAMNIMDYARRRILARFAANLQRDLETSFHALPPRLTTRRLKSASALTPLDNLRGFLHSSHLLNVIDLLWLPLFVGTVFLISPIIGWLSIIGVISLGGIYYLGRILSSNKIGIAKEASQKTARAKDTISRVSRWQGGIHFGTTAEKWILGHRTESRIASIGAADRTTMFDSAVTCLRLCFAIAVLSVCAGLVLKNQLTIGGMVASVVLLNRVFAPFISFLKSTPNLRNAIADWKEIGNKLNSFQEKPVSDIPLNIHAPLLELRSLSISGWDQEENILNDVNLEIWPGEIVQITGRPGCGKTQLCESITWAERPKSGLILAFGCRLSQLDFDQKSNLFGYLPELPVFFGNSIAANISGLESETVTAEIRTAAEFSNLDSLILELPNGYDTVIDELGKPLSRTQREQLSLARALYRRPRLIIVDQPSEFILNLLQLHRVNEFKKFLSNGAILITSEKPIEFTIPTRQLEIRNNCLRKNKGINSLATLPVVAVNI